MNSVIPDGDVPAYRPTFPEHRLGVGIVGAGAIARSAHLPAYREWDVPVVAVTSRTVADAQALAADFGIATVHESLESLLADPRVEVVDLATGPAGRVELIAAAVAAGKHVLAQKPLVSAMRPSCRGWPRCSRRLARRGSASRSTRTRGGLRPGGSRPC
ncbi:Gfo/Idh/MocA family protein [Microbacterium sp. W4I20]|uniref:Gfo/Idh/MocA family protein n=1 Tax=Microbacterium sp. W4I20 TaxID=3042262 RepID=UPI002783CD87|nr:Gfo/Idh/MocA family oxidoreductase [Microbacterium sp. W4I20]MDQ0727665.1 shikimate 5-dehydrogenase [Microbacterium sp. W4I20]